MNSKLKIKDLRKVKGVADNPFATALLEEFQSVTRREYLNSDRSKGVVNNITDSHNNLLGESRFFRVKKVDTATFTKVFTDKVSALWDMPSNATRVFAYIQTILHPNKDTIYFLPSEAQEKTNYTEATVWKGVKWLMENDFIAKSNKPYIYFINPTIFFNGDRVAFVEVIEKQRPAGNSNPNAGFELDQSRDPQLTIEEAIEREKDENQ